MQILWLTYYYLPHVGGGTWSTYFISKTLSLKGHNIEVIAPNIRFSLSISKSASNMLEVKNPSVVYKVPFFPIPRIIGPFVSFLPLFLKGLKHGKKADIIFCQFHPHHLTLFSAVLIGRIFRKPIVARACDIHRDMGSTSFTNNAVTVVNFLNEFLIKYVQLFLVNCLDHKNLLVERIGNKSYIDKIIVTSNGFDSTDFENLPSKVSARKELNIKSNERVLLFIGRFSGEEYGTQIILTAFSLLLSKEPDAVLYLVGDKLTSTLRTLISSLGIEEKIRIYASIPHKEVVKFILASDVCIGPIMPTHAMPLKILEYMACGKPIVTGKGSVCSDLKPNFNFIESLPTPTVLSQTLLMVLRDYELSTTLSLRGKELSKTLSWQNVANDIEIRLNELIKNRKSDK